MSQEIASLQGIHESIYLSDKRTPLTKVLLFDATDTMSDIVLENYTQVPLDITRYLLSWSINQQEGEATTANFTVLSDPLDSEPLTPWHFMGRKIVQIFYADLATNQEFGTEYIPLFTGVCVGQPGYKRDRSSGEKTIEVSCIDRTFFYNKRQLNSKTWESYNVSSGDIEIDLGEIAVEIATDSDWGMGLQREEVRFGLFRHLMQHTHLAIYDVSYMEGLTNLGFIFGLSPAFDGGGFLIMRDANLDKPPARVYQDESLFVNIDWPSSNVDLYTRVKVVGLSNAIEKVVSPLQELVTIKGTIGYFEDAYKTTCWYSEDRQARAQNVQIVSWKMNGQLQKFLPGRPKLQQIGEFSCVVIIETPYQAWVFVIFFSVYIAFFAIAVDIIPIFGSFMRQVMSLVAAIWLCGGLMLMQQMGTFEVTVGGEPYKLVYKEIEGIAEWGNLQPYEVRELVIENHLVYSQTLADALAYRELVREKCKTVQRNLTLPADLFLQPTDIIELPDGTRYYITSISREFKRGEGMHTMQLSCYVVRNGKEYNGISGFSEY